MTEKPINEIYKAAIFLFVTIVLCAAIIFFIIFAIPDEVESTEQKFKVEFVVTFNAVTLRQAADYEKELRELFEKKACNISASVERIGDQEITWEAAPAGIDTIDIAGRSSTIRDSVIITFDPSEIGSPIWERPILLELPGNVIINDSLGHHVWKSIDE